MKRLVLVISVLFVLALIATACGSPQASAPPPSPTTEAPASPATPSPEAKPEPAPVTTTPAYTTPSPIPPISDEELKVYFIDVGQGDSILIDLAEIEILIDGGGKSPGVVPFLRDYVDGALEVVVATHPHADHIGGLISVLSSFEVEEIWHNGDTSTSQTFSQFMAGVNSEGAEVTVALVGDTIEVGELVLDVLHPADTKGSTNSNSIVLRLTYGEIDFLFEGDAEQEAEGEMLEAGLLGDIEVLKIGHHCSKTASSVAFINLIRPEIAVYMAKEGNSYGHPHQEALDTLGAVGAGVYGTDVHGNVVITTDGNTFDIATEK
ncbi:MBL fold metallo-hydrolase [Chloroflexota bacterium]